MAHESGKNGGVFSSSLLVEDCEDAWTNDNITSSNTDADSKVGTSSVKLVIPGALGANILLAHEAGLTLNLTTYDALFFWMKDSIGSTLNDNQLLLDDTADCLSPIELLQIRALTSGTWAQCFNPLADPSLLAAIVSVGVKQIAALGARNIFIDEIRALKEIDGIKSWTLEYTSAVLNTTDFANAGVSAFIPGLTEWSGSFDGYKDGVPLGIGSEVYLVLGETSVGSQCWLGKAIIMAARPNTDHDGIVSYSYDFQGTAALEAPST